MLGKTIKPFVSITLLAMGILILYRFIAGKIPSASGNNTISAPKDAMVPLSHHEVPWVSALGFVAAFMDAVGGGWGPIATPGLILTGDHERCKIVRSVNLVQFFVTIAEVLTFILVLGLEQFRWDMVGALLLGGAVAAPTAAFLCKRMPHRVLGILIGIALMRFNPRTLVLSILR